MKIGVAVVLLLALSETVHGNPNDFTCINTNPAFGATSDVNIVAVGPSKQPVEIRRYMPTTSFDNCDVMPLNIEEARGDDITVRSLHYDGDDAVRTGVFSCKTTADGVPITIPVFSHLNTTEVLPDDHVTTTVSRGEQSTLSVVDNGRSKLIWTRSGRGAILQVIDTSYTVENTIMYYQGIYEAYKRKTLAHAVMRIIVRKCPPNLCGVGCRDTCFCYNGGVCTKNCECICPPGFTGDQCEIINEANCFGQNCQYLCSDDAFADLGISATCKGHLFCLPDPYGCSCYPGYKGIGCDIACPAGTFGADCKQICHCAPDTQCDGKRGTCNDDCAEGWIGVNCNEKISCKHSPCQHGGICTDIRLNNEYTCECPDAYFGRNCEESESPCECEVWGDPHHITFDRQIFTFQGECEYIITRHSTGESEASGLPAFSLLAQYHKQEPSASVTYVSSIRLILDDNTYKLHNNLLYVNGVQVTTPFNTTEISVTLQPNSAFLLETDFGLVVRYIGETVSVSLPSVFKNKVNGICGNCNGEKNDDCKGNSRESARCGHQWAVSDNCEVARPVDSCLENVANRDRAMEICNIMIDNSGPFSACGGTVDIEPLKSVCLYDLCATLPDESLICTHLEHLTSICTTNGIDVGNWRDFVPICAPWCPFGTTYTLCGNACPSTCTSIGGNCALTDCVETCECPENYVIANGQCIPVDECGCRLPDGGYLPLNEVHINDDCTQRCICDSGRLSCSAITCSANANCQIKSGVQRCYCEKGFTGDGITCTPVATCECTVWGDPHYITFDDLKYDFQGECEYTLLKPCNTNGDSIPNFELIGNNFKNLPTDSVALTREIKLNFGGKVYTLQRNKVVLVDSLIVPCPYNDGNGVHISITADLTVLYTNFGLSVKWNNNERAIIQIIKDELYIDNTCGLCGTCNDNKFDDFLTSTGQLTSNAIDFGTSWRTGDKSCDDPIEVIICKVNGVAHQSATSSCYAIIDILGALAVCHDFLDPQPFYESCNYDVCSNIDNSLCDNMNAYVQACITAGGNPNFWWRDRPECTPECPPTAIFIPKFYGCPPTCAHPRGQPDCPFEFISTCVCPVRAVLHNGECNSECGGCRLENGAYVESGSVIINDDCTQSCTCTEGQMVCTPIACGEFASCGVVAGERHCKCRDGYEGDGFTCREAACQCIAWGDPHYTTFDGGRYDFQGECEYVLVQRCSDEEETGPISNYKIIAKNVKNSPTASVSYVRAVRLEVNGNSYEVQSGGNVFINGMQEPLPYTDTVVYIYRLNLRSVVLETSFQLTIIYESPYTVTIKAYHDQHYGKTCGLCGTCNGNAFDEYVLPNGRLETNANNFANAWTVEGTACIVEPDVDVCEKNSAEHTQALTVCGVMTSTLGPFSGCHAVADPDEIFETCVYDVCAVANENEALCNNLNVYARRCQAAGVSPGEWWQDVPQCPSLCPEGTVYDSCGSACQPTCERDESTDCKLLCEEVCRCPDGQLLDGDQCVPESECGCKLPNGGYLQVNDDWINEDCSERCFCHPQNGIECTEYTCPDLSKCGVNNGQRRCYCPVNYLMFDDECKRPSCVCNIFGDPHYSTFDKRRYDYQGDCEYVLIEKCNDSVSLPDFRLIGEHSKNAPGDAVSYLRYLRLEYMGNTYEIFISGKVKVNGRRVNKHYSDEDLGITIGNAVFGFTTIHLSFGLFIMYDNVQSAEIHLNTEHMGLTCGMCGTCTDNTEDDYLLPDGQITQSVLTFGTAYMNDKSCTTRDVTGTSCEVRSENEVRAKDFCSLLIRKPGPFSPCYDFIDPQDFYNACVMDVCISLIPAFSCTTMKLYAQQCIQVGGSPGEWWLEALHCIYKDGKDPEDELYTPFGIEQNFDTNGCEIESDALLPIRTRNKRNVASGNVGERTMSRHKRQAVNNGNQAGTTCPPGMFLYTGTGCQITCDDRHGTINCQENDSIQTCVCPRLTLLLDNTCVRVEDCGCIAPDGSNMQAGDTFISENCDETCMCDVGDSNPVCVDQQCDAKASCILKDGIKGCHCRNGYTGDGLTCTGDGLNGGCSGDPHFTTFDNLRYDFQGSCEYVLVQRCGVSEEHLESFKLIGNFRSPPGIPHVTLTVSVRLEYGGSVFEIMGQHGSLVDGVLVNLPFTKGSVTMSYIPPTTWKITAEFGLVIRCSFSTWNNIYYGNVAVELPPEYTGYTCGLFGTATGTTSDDLLLPNKQYASNVREFGDAWQTGNRQCSSRTEQYDVCPAGTALELAAENKCSVLIKRHGIFEGCRDFVDPNPIYQTCIYDVCATNLDKGQFCKNVQKYVDDCQNFGGNPGNWWNIVTDCAPPCPVCMEHTKCGTACPATCQNPEGDPNCPNTCIETCLCPEGMVLDGERCTFPYNCGCNLPNGVYIREGQEYTYEDCSLQCTCTNGEDSCVPFGCDQGEVCTIVGEVRGCFCPEGFEWNGQECSNAPCQCTVWGDPHYTTFDGKKYDFQGDCEYVLVTTCNEEDSPSFKVIGNNEKNVPSQKVSYIRSVRLEYDNVVYELTNAGTLKVNGVLKALPFTSGGINHVTITFVPPNRLLLTTYFGLQLLFHFNQGGLKIEVGAEYYHKLCGMCGTCNKDVTDEFNLPSRNLANSASEFGNSWKTGDNECVSGNDETPCTPDSEKERDAEVVCSPLTTSIPFETCHGIVDPTPFYEACTYDVCVTGEDESLCNSLQQYAAACRRAGGDPGQWWESIPQCDALCPEDMIYTHCGSPCPETCVGRERDIPCNHNTCFETCVCPEGKILDGTRCVYPRECGCNTPYDTYISPGSTFVTRDCSQRCTCTLGNLECEDYQCSPHATCEVKSGDQDCFCSNGYVGNGHECVQSDCECLIWTDAHLRTFDNLGYTFDTTCMTDRVLVMSNDQRNEENQFDLIGNFEVSNGAVYLRSLNLSFTDGIYFLHEIDRDGILSLDGIQKSVNYKTDRLSLSSDIGGGLVLSTDFGLSVYWNLGNLISIKITPAWRGTRAVGLCGTCNNDQSDDMQTPDGTTWIAPECIVDVNDVPVSQEGTDECYVLINTNGPFANCHDYVHPSEHYKTCLYDYSKTANYICDNFASYAKQCIEAGGNPDNWRDQVTQCSYICPSRSAYSQCTNAWSASCTFPDGRDNTLHDCVEACVCRFGLLSANNQCVKKERCPCFVPSFGLISDGQKVTDKLCTKQCVCEDQAVTCNNNYTCGSHSFCGVESGNYQCLCDTGYEHIHNCHRCLKSKPEDCYDLLLAGYTEDGMYNIYPTGWSEGFLEVYCDMTNDGGGWIVIQNREDSTISFNRDWNEYKEGFGELQDQFWLGNEALYAITSQKNYGLQINLIKKSNGQVTFVDYADFSIASEDNHYQLQVGGFSSDTEPNNFLESHSGSYFSTPDRDNGQLGNQCAAEAGGGWWYINYIGCFFVDLNGDYDSSFAWYSDTLSQSTMKIRPDL